MLSATIFLTDLGRKSEMKRAWKRWLDPEHFPARATVGVADLGEDTLIEITITAAMS